MEVAVEKKPSGIVSFINSVKSIDPFILLIWFYTLILFVCLIFAANSASNMEKFSRGMYVHENIDRFRDGKITVEDISILNKLGDSENYIEDYKYFLDNK